MLPWLEALEDDDTAVVGTCKAKSGGIGGMLVLAVASLDGKEYSRSIEEGAAGRCAASVLAKANANRGQMQGDYEERKGASLNCKPAQVKYTSASQCLN
jgi:hypothetical protein